MASLGAALLAMGLLAACDSKVGIKGTDYDTGEPAPARPSSSSSPAAPTPAAAPGELSVTVTLKTRDPEAADALTRWAMDLQQLPTPALERRCWTMAPRNVETMYADKQAILAALTQPGTDDGTAITWKSPATAADGVTVVAERADIATGYACPRVFPAGTEPGFDDADARHTVRRYLARLSGSPLDPADRPGSYPLVCAASPATWDPTGTGRPTAPPLATEPDKLTGVQSFVDQSITSRSVRGDYIAVSVPVTTAAGRQDRTFTLRSGEQGYCIGDVSA